MAEDSTFDPIPTDIAELLALFDEPLREVRFPDVDRESLRALAEDVRARAAALQRLEAQVREARAALAEAQSVLCRAAHRGLAYATVYADGDTALSERIAGLSLGSSAGESRSVTRPRSVRGRKVKEAEATGTGKAAGTGKAGKGEKARPTAELPFAHDQDTGAAAAPDAA